MKKNITAFIIIIVSFIGLFGYLSGNTNSKDTLKVYNWVKYIGKNTIVNFEKEYNCQVIYDNYSSNEEMIAKVKNGAKYDIVFPTDYAVTIMKEAGLLVPLDKTIVTNLNNIESKFLSPPYDPDNIYTIPYHWGSSGIAYNYKKMPEPDSYSVLWDKKYKSRVAVPDDPRNVTGMILHNLGKSANSTESDDLQKMHEKMKALKDNILSFSSYNEKTILSGELDLVYGYSTGLLQIIGSEHPYMKFTIPKEGTILWLDNLAITKNSENKELANKFINYMLRPDVIAEISNEIYAANANQASKPLLKPELLENKMVYPDESIMNKAEFIKDLGKDNDLFMNIWLSVKTK